MNIHGFILLPIRVIFLPFKDALSLRPQIPYLFPSKRAFQWVSPGRHAFFSLQANKLTCPVFPALTPVPLSFCCLFLSSAVVRPSLALLSLLSLPTLGSSAPFELLLFSGFHPQLLYPTVTIRPLEHLFGFAKSFWNLPLTGPGSSPEPPLCPPAVFPYKFCPVIRYHYWHWSLYISFS